MKYSQSIFIADKINLELNVRDFDMSLTDRQKNLLRAVAPFLEKEKAGEEFLLHSAGPIFVFGDDGTYDDSWTKAWKGVTRGELEILVREQFLLHHPDRHENYVFHAQNILDAVARDFGSTEKTPTVEDSRTLNIFISYKHEDEIFVKQLEDMLRDAYNVWYDRKLYAGEDFEIRIISQIKLCQIFIFVLTLNSIESEWCTKELEVARSSEKLIIPILLENSIPSPTPEWLQKRQNILMRGGVIDQLGTQKLFTALVKYRP